MQRFTNLPILWFIQTEYLKKTRTELVFRAGSSLALLDVDKLPFKRLKDHISNNQEVPSLYCQEP
jgi:hypothetical protein